MTVLSSHVTGGYLFLAEVTVDGAFEIDPVGRGNSPAIVAFRC